MLWNGRFSVLKIEDRYTIAFLVTAGAQLSVISCVIFTRAKWAGKVIVFVLISYPFIILIA